MNKNLIIFGILILLICVGLSGCEEEKSNQSENEDMDNNNTGNTEEEEFAEPIIIDHNSHNTLETYLTIFGLVKNMADKNIDYVKLTITLYSSTGGIIDSDYTYAHPTTIKKNSTGCFWTMFSDIPSYYDHYDIEITSFKNYDTQIYDKFELTDVNYMQEEVTLLDGTVELQDYITGKIKNTGYMDMVSVEIYGIYYDLNDKIVGMCFYTIFSLNAGQKETFKTLPIVTPDTFSDYELIIDYTEE